jgi:hypothetical protein
MDTVVLYLKTAHIEMQISLRFSLRILLLLFCRFNQMICVIGFVQQGRSIALYLYLF